MGQWGKAKEIGNCKFIPHTVKNIIDSIELVHVDKNYSYIASTILSGLRKKHIGRSYSSWCINDKK